MNTGIVMLLLALLVTLSGCTYDTLAPIDECTDQVSLTVVETSPAACGIATGHFQVLIANGDPAAETSFSLDGINFQADGIFTDLTAGTYTVQAISGFCSATTTVEIINSDGLNASLETTPSGCGSNTGIITVNISDAIGAVSFSLNEGNSQDDPTFTGLASGDYEVTVTDASGCELSLSTTIASDIAYDDVATIISTSCALSGCHAGNVVPDLRVKSNIIANSGRIMARTGARSMPPSSSGITLTENQIEAISCWVNDGSPE